MHLRARHIGLAALLVAAAAARVLAAPEPQPPAPKAAPAVRALILASQTVDPKGPYARNMSDWVRRFVDLLHRRAGLPLANIRVLAETPDAKAAPAVTTCTLDNVRAAFDALRTELTPADQFVLVILGHGTVTDPVGKLCLVGEDLKATVLAEWLDKLPTRRIVIVNCASGGAEFLEKYSRPGRVVVSATGNLGEGNQTYFAEFFLQTYESGRADRNADGVVTVLEAFNEAAHRCINWYHRQYKIPPPKDAPPGPREVEVRTAEARRLFRKFYDGIGDLVMVTPETDEDESTDPPLELADLQQRREAGEHASLEDRGENNGTLYWAQNKAYPLDGKRGEQGEIAARTVIGTPELRPPALPAGPVPSRQVGTD